MKKRHFDVETDGFYGAYWKCKTGSDCAMIAMIGDDPEDYLARTSVKWLHKLGVNVMTMSPGKKDYGHHNYPLERIPHFLPDNVVLRAFTELVSDRFFLKAERQLFASSRVSEKLKLSQ